MESQATLVAKFSISVAAGILLVIAFTGAADQSKDDLPRTYCRRSCGHLRVPYPFGMDEGCYMEDKFLITCNESFRPPKAFLMKGNLPVTHLSLDDGELDTMNFIARDCYNQQGKRVQVSNSTLWLSVASHYTISSSKNKFFAVGCDTNAFVEANGVNKRYATGCISFCNSTGTFNESCSGDGCCQTSIVGGLKDITVRVFSYYNHSGILSFNPCGFAFVANESKFKFSNTSFQELNKTEMLPIVINWAIGTVSERCEEAQKLDNYTCKANSKCIDVHDGSGGYRCRCLPGFKGNPYLPEGCLGTLILFYFFSVF